MSKTDLLERRDRAAEALADAGRTAAAWPVVDQIRQKALDLASVARDRAAEVGGQARERAMARAQELKDWAQDRAATEVVRRRATAADGLESLAEILRPDSHRRRKTLLRAGGSGLALTAAVGIGVALGFTISRELKKRKEKADKVSARMAAPVTPANNGRVSDEPAGYDAEVGAGLGAV
jgi:hypothetical protein